MPPLEHMDMHDRAMLWVIARHDRRGMPLVLPPTEIVCRWEEGQVEMKDSEGQILVLDVSITTVQDIRIGSLLWEGSEEDLEDLVGTSLTPTSGIFEVILRSKAKDLRGRVQRYEFGLRRFKDTMAGIVDS